jgi:hypothetical protein
MISRRRGGASAVPKAPAAAPAVAAAVGRAARTAPSGPVERTGLSVSVASVVVVVLVILVGLTPACGHRGAGRQVDLRQVMLAHDDNRAVATLAFPSLTYESLVRFELPPGKQRPWRLWLLAESAGTVAITIYENSLFESPGDPIRVFTRELVADDLSKGKDGRWIVEDLEDLDPIQGTVWIGVRKLAGTPTLWTSAVVSGQTYLRDRDPARGIDLLPVKRAPMIRLELAGPDTPYTPPPDQAAAVAAATARPTTAAAAPDKAGALPRPAGAAIFAK